MVIRSKEFIDILPIHLIVLIYLLLSGCASKENQNWKWETIEANGEPTARHEAGLVAYKDQIILIGGRRINPTDIFDTKTNTWTSKSAPPIEVHHFQPVSVNDAIYLIGAMTGQWPNEKPLDRILIYYPEQDKYEYGHEIPKARRRGGAGAVYFNDKIYLVGGIINGHMNGYKPWFDEYDPKTGDWRVLPDAPDARDHFQAVVSNNQLFAFAGRRSSHKTGEDMDLTNSYGNVYDFTTREWKKVTQNLAIPTERAGNSAIAWKDEIILGGGESAVQKEAHRELEAYNSETKTWRSWPSLNRGRHGSGFAVIDDYLYTASGSENSGGGPELTSVERLKLRSPVKTDHTENVDQTSVYKQFHTVTLTFEGPETSESDEDNPFLNYRLRVQFKNDGNVYNIHGFYSADGDAAETGAANGNVWEVRFTPELLGQWSYTATLHHGDSIALSDDTDLGTSIEISPAIGEFIVIKSDKEGPDFRANGHLDSYQGYYRFRSTEKYWLKGGTNSPENLLGYEDFDGTYRIQASAREGEASTNNEIHSFPKHLQDWNQGDPTWKGGKGKSLIGAMNYLASKGMNSSYFLTLNILGDGKDVWPFVTPNDFTRFDVSKLEQWEVLFQHMQRQGIMLHMVLQETENETMLDNGDTGPLRQLYFRELIARFGHHLALTWNLGEENGPASWSPIGQNDAQRKNMAKFLKETDPYDHPVLLHTHSHDPLRSDILDSIAGYPYLDGLSLQQDKRKMAPNVVETWRKKSRVAGRDWLITMDEIGMWHTAALPDSIDPTHNTLRRYALWGTLLSGGAGVEWYFGAKYPHNDLTSEDWRQRDRLWDLTHHAMNFFDQYIPYWEMEPKHHLVNSLEAYCLQKADEFYAIYLPDSKPYTLDLPDSDSEFDVLWYNPLLGGELQKGSLGNVKGGEIKSLGNPPSGGDNSTTQDWVCLVRKKL
ncbi:Kelch repeat-containing protein [Ekhidna sp.]